MDSNELEPLVFDLRILLFLFKENMCYLKASGAFLPLKQLSSF